MRGRQALKLMAAIRIRIFQTRSSLKKKKKKEYPPLHIDRILLSSALARAPPNHTLIARIFANHLGEICFLSNLYLRQFSPRELEGSLARNYYVFTFRGAEAKMDRGNIKVLLQLFFLFQLRQWSVRHFTYMQSSGSSGCVRWMTKKEKRKE